MICLNEVSLIFEELNVLIEQSKKTEKNSDAYFDCFNGIYNKLTYLQEKIGNKNNIILPKKLETQLSNVIRYYNLFLFDKI